MSSTLWIVALGCLALGAALAVAFDRARKLAQADRAKLVDQVADAVVARQSAEQAAAEKQARADELAALLMGTEDDKRLKAHWGVVEASERLTSINLRALENAQVAFAHLENAMLYAEWLRARGNPNAPWAEIVRWKNQQENKG